MNRLFKMAIRLGVMNAVQLYIAKGVDVNANDDGGMSPLMYAADAGQPQICSVLLEAGADPLQCNAEGKDARFFALKNGSSEVIGVLAKFLVNRTAEELVKPEAEHSRADDSAFHYADRFPSYHNEEIYFSEWEEYSESPSPAGDPIVDSAAGGLQTLISLYATPETGEDWSEVEIDLPNADDFLTESKSEYQGGIGNPASGPDSISARSQIYVVEIGGIYFACHPEVFARYQAQLRETATLSTAELNSLSRTIRADLASLNNAEVGRQTVWSVVEAIVSRQQDFLARGLKHLRPMMLKDIADEVGIDNSTASRIVNRVRAHTPQGVIPLRSLFSGYILNEFGEEISTQAIKQRVKELLIQEPETAPITDAQIVDRLREENINISRRTVAKYRQQFEILGSRERGKGLTCADISERVVKKPFRFRAEPTPTELENNSGAPKGAPKKNRLEEMGEKYFREAREAMGAEKYESAIAFLNATILCGYRPAESLYQFGRAHLEIVSRTIPSLSPSECKSEDIRLHLTAAINGFSRAIKLEPELVDAYVCLGIAYALLGDKDSAFRQKTVLEGLESPASDTLNRSLDFILSRRLSS